jgi:hypothetical protein
MKCFIYIGLINAGSVNSKSDVIFNYLAKNGFDVLAITENWLSVERGDDDLRLLFSDGFNVFHSPMMGRTGGGVAVLARILLTLLNLSLLTPLRNLLSIWLCHQQSILCAFVS